MRPRLILFGALLLSSCAFPHEIRRLGVSYNNAIADLGDQLTLLNIERAEEGLPLHYTSFSRLSGSLTFTGGGSFNGALRADGVTDTSQTATTMSATPSATTTITRAIASGGNIYTPNISAMVTTGPTFDVSVLDTQEFYQGILKEIPFDTVNAFLANGYSDQLLIHLLVHRIDYVQIDQSGDPSRDVLLASFVNEPGRLSVHPERFDALIACLSLRGVAGAPHRLAPLSRVTEDGKGGTLPLKIDDFAKVDGKALDFSGELSKTVANDANIYLQRPADAARKPVMDYVASAKCPAPYDARPLLVEPTSLRASAGASGASSTGSIDRNELAVVKMLSENVLVPSPQKGPGLTAEISAPTIERFITFRSPEGVIKYLGEYLRVYHRTASHAGVPKVGGRFVFATDLTPSPPPGALVARVANATYAIAKDPNAADPTQYRRNLDVLALVQDLLNLQKKSDDRLTTVPVQIIR